ncbi:MAG: sulfatase-like hydrolase/transferase [Anaerolineales bacterium]|nr:sulfatase-like hydrolase/transferase [Anaerolineales bacterium]
MPKLQRSDLLAAASVFLLAAAPILALHNFNIQYLHYSAVLRSLWLALLGAAGLLLLFGLLFRNVQRASALANLFLLLFFTYGHVFNLLSAWREPPNLLLSGLWLGLFVLGAWLLASRPLAWSEKLNSFLLVAAGLLVVFNLSNILLYENAKHRANLASLRSAAEQTPAGLDPDAPRPDIYYIILDAHARSDVLLERFGYDDTAFIQNLESQGFYVAACSQANYWRTEFSIGSALRMDYFGPEFREADALPDWQFSAVIQTLKQLGYQVVSFETRATHNQEIGQDVLLSRRSQTTLYENFYPFANLNDFEANLVKTTWLHSWLQLLGNYQGLLPEDMILDADNAAYLEHYRQTLYILDELPRVPYLDSPKFVYVHLLVPHEPFVFDASGRYHFRHTQDEFTEGYRNNAEFIDARIAEVLAEIIENSAAPPIIILQGDHGPNGSPPETLLPILNAYHFPGGDAGLYERISPVNSFRALFGHYFGADYATLQDVSYYGRGTDLSEGVLVENYCD